METIVLYGKRLKMVEDDGVCCGDCALQQFNVCHPQACKDEYGNMNRHFEEV